MLCSELERSQGKGHITIFIAVGKVRLNCCLSVREIHPCTYIGSMGHRGPESVCQNLYSPDFHKESNSEPAKLSMLYTLP